MRGEILALKQSLGLQDRRITVTVGRLVTRKGHDQVIGALPRVVETVPNAVYLVVGEGPSRDVLEGLVREQDMESHVLFVGSRNPDEVAPYYQIADLFITPSRNIEGDAEGFGIAFLEASASGIPVIAGASGGTADAVAHGTNGFLVDPLNGDDIASHVVRILSDRELAARMGMAGRAMVERGYSWERSASQLAATTELMPTESSRKRLHSPLCWASVLRTVSRRD